MTALSLDPSCSCQNTIYQSGDNLISFALRDCKGEAFNLSSATEIEVIFPTLVAPPLVKKLSLSQVTITYGVGGLFTVLISKSDALLLTLGSINIEVRVTISGQTNVIQLLGVVTVVASLFPTVS